MKRSTPKIKVFIDTNVLIAGICSATGASAAILDLCEAGLLDMVISRQVLIEADRNVSVKLPMLVDRFRQFIHEMTPLMVEDPGPEAVGKAAAVVGRKDASILAAAEAARADFLVTLDKRHFLSSRTGKEFILKVVSPAEFLRAFEQMWLQ